MPRPWKALIVTAAVLLGTLGVMSLASASADNTTVLHLVTKTVQSTDLDLGKKGFSQGDQFLFADNVFRGGKKVGTDGGVCTATRVTSAAQEFQCVVSVRLPEGQLTVQGLIDFSGKTSTFAITGGTGRYRDAGGYVVVPNTDSDTTAITVFVDDLSE
jgi:hypothetical protein